jgi:hypothetical protein
MLISPGAGAARTSEHTVARAGAHWGGGGLRWANTMCGVAWRSRDGPRSRHRGPTCTAQSTPLCNIPYPRVSQSGTQGRFSFAAGSSADDGSPGAWAGHRGRKNEQFGKDRPVERLHVARRTSRGQRRKVGNNASTFSMIRQSHHHHHERVPAQ